MFDRFTERARKVMTLARMEAGKLKNDYIGTEHILLGLVVEGSGVAAQVLKNLGVDLRQVRAVVEQLVEQGNRTVTGQLPFTPRAKRVLELALEEAQSLGHNYIGTEHLLLGILAENDGPAAHVLQRLEVDIVQAREEVVELIGADARSRSERAGLAVDIVPRSSVKSAWESVPASPVVDWAMVARMREKANVLVEAGLPWAKAIVFFELVPRKGGWSYRISVGLVPRKGHQDAICITVPGGPLKELEKDLPALIGSLLKSIEGKDDGGGVPG